MDIAVKYICTRFVEFKDRETNKIIKGFVTYVLKEDTNEIIKCKMVQDNVVGYSIGDDCFITLTVNGIYAHYSFKVS